MAKTITQLTDATVVNAADELIIQQGGVTKRATKTEVLNGIVNSNIDASAAIAYSKLNLSNSIVAGDITADAVTPAKLSQPYTLATSQASTSGTNIDFTGIPSWVKRITVMLSGVSLSGTAHILIQLGSGSFATSGYASWSNFLLGGSSSGLSSSSSGFIVHLSSAANSVIGTINIDLLAGNTWTATGVGAYVANGAQMFTAGNVALSGALDRLRVTNTGSDTFDAGTINISYAG